MSARSYHLAQSPSGLQFQHLAAIKWRNTQWPRLSPQSRDQNHCPHKHISYVDRVYIDLPQSSETDNSETSEHEEGNVNYTLWGLLSDESVLGDMTRVDLEDL